MARAGKDGADFSGRHVHAGSRRPTTRGSSPGRRQPRRVPRPAGRPPMPSPHGRWLAPRDLQAGGTWLGVNPGGLFVGVTNRTSGPRNAVPALARAPGGRGAGIARCGEPSPPGRGAQSGSLQRLPPRLRRRDVRWTDLERREQPPAGAARGGRARAHRAEPRSGGRRDAPAPGAGPGRSRASWSTSRGGSRCLSVHGPEPRAGTCVHADAVGYGTRSAFVCTALRPSAEQVRVDGGPPVHQPRPGRNRAAQGRGPLVAASGFTTRRLCPASRRARPPHSVRRVCPARCRPVPRSGRCPTACGAR